MPATLIAGTELTLIGATRRGARRYRSVVADIHHDRIVLDTGTHEVLPTSGSSASFLHQGRVYDCSVVRGHGTTVTVSRPDDLDAADQRNSRRVATSLPASVRRSLLRGDVHAAQVSDLSLGGTRLVTEDAGYTVGDELDLRMGSIAVLATVRHVLPHEHHRLCVLGMAFAPLGDDQRWHLLETLGSLRAGIHRWR